MRPSSIRENIPASQIDGSDPHEADSASSGSFSCVGESISLEQLPRRTESLDDIQYQFLGSSSSESDSVTDAFETLPDQLIDLCDETEDEVVEVGVTAPSPSRNSFFVSNSPIVGLSEMFSITQLLEGERIAIGGSVDSIFNRIQQHIRAQALFLGQVGLFGANPMPTVQPNVLLNHLPIRRLSGISEATSLGSCPICLEPYKPRMQVRTIPGCGHFVHKTCMDKWITKSHRNTCPLDNITIQIASSGAPTTARSQGTVSRGQSPSRSPNLRRSRRIITKSSSRGV
jgi:hypothetical protein